MGYMMRIRTISIFFSLKWSQTIYSQCNIVPVKLNGALNPSTLNWAEGNESSSFIAESKIISTFLPNDIFQRIKSIPYWPDINWPKIKFVERFFISFSPVFVSMICYKIHVHANSLIVSKNHWSYCNHMKVNFHLLVRCCLLQNLPNKTPPPPQKKGNYLKKNKKNRLIYY